MATSGANTRSEYLHLVDVYLPIAAAVFALVTMVLIGFLVRYRARPGDGRRPSRRSESNTVEGVYVAVLAGVAAFLVFISLHTETKVDPVAKKAALHVRVIGAKWLWRFQYSGTNVIQGTINGRARLVVPAGRTIVFDGTSLDVIHDFWIPRMNYQHQIFPDKVETWDMLFPKPGVYPGECAWFCGLYHQNMHFDVVAVAPSRFTAWLRTRIGERGRPA